MRAALDLARAAERLGEVPVGAVIVADGTTVAGSHNLTQARHDPLAHAEQIVLSEALRRLGADRLTTATLYVTLEPCGMCAGAIILAKVGRVVFGAWDEKAGMAGSVGDVLRNPRLNHHPEVVGGVLEVECGDLLRAFFRQHR